MLQKPSRSAGPAASVAFVQPPGPQRVTASVSGYLCVIRLVLWIGGIPFVVNSDGDSAFCEAPARQACRRYRASTDATPRHPLVVVLSRGQLQLCSVTFAVLPVCGRQQWQ